LFCIPVFFPGYLFSSFFFRRARISCFRIREAFFGAWEPPLSLFVSQPSPFFFASHRISPFHVLRGSPLSLGCFGVLVLSPLIAFCQSCGVVFFSPSSPVPNVPLRCFLGVAVFYLLTFPSNPPSFLGVQFLCRLSF